MSDGQMLRVLGNFLHDLRHGDTLLQETTLMDQTLRRYVESAANFFTLLTRRRCLAYDETTLHQAKPALHPYLREQLTQRSNWKKPRAKIEPFTSPMFESLNLVIQASTDPARMFLSDLHAVYDWIRLGLFTGSRLGEYGQSRLRRGVRYNTIPSSIDAGEWAGRSLAFIAADYTFYSHSMHIIMHTDICSYHAHKKIRAVSIRFRFDKSKENFLIRKFESLDHPIFNPVDAIVSIFRRAQSLHVPPEEPLGVFQKQSGTYHFIKDTTVCTIMRQACCLAYPDPAHQLRVNISRLVAHSNRVTAAVCLQQGGATTDEIAYRLRWQPASVPTYLRECYSAIGDILQKALLGAFRST
jgi:hypothetical protein